MPEGKKTVIIGASNNPERYAYLAATFLQERGHEFVPVGIRKAAVLGHEILNIKDLPKIENTDTVTMYLHPRNQIGWYDYIKSLHPKRVIFNPGTENPEFEELLSESNIEVVEACTLVMLRTGQY